MKDLEVMAYHSEATRDDLKILAFLTALNILGQRREERGHVIATINTVVPSLYHPDSIRAV